MKMKSVDLRDVGQSISAHRNKSVLFHSIKADCPFFRTIGQ